MPPNSKVDFVLLLLFVLERITEAVNRSSCDHTFTDQYGSITTPNYPFDYPNSISCVWRIRAPQGYYIELNFHDFDVEPFRDCKTDVLEVKDGSSRRAPLLGPQFCNTQHPPARVTSSKNHLRLWFASDSTIQHRGFNVTYKFIHDQGCGGVINATHGIIESPRFPQDYPRHLHCEWKLIVPKGKYIALKFNTFDIERICPVHEPCKCLDYVAIREGNGKDLGKHCLGAPLPFIASGNELIVMFSSDQYGRNQGFQALFTQSTTPYCGGDHYTKTGTIQSPLYDDYHISTYPSYSNCIWVIRASDLEYISMQFTFLDVLASTTGTCWADYIEVRDGPYEYSPIIGRFCNAYAPKVISSTGSSMYIRFRSDYQYSGKGFQLKYQFHNKSCSSSLGMEDYRLSNGDMFGTSYFEIPYWPYKLDTTLGRLNGPFAWCTQEQDFDYDDEFMEINFRGYRKITEIASQGFLFNGEAYFVKSYRLQYQVANGRFENYVTLADAHLGKSFSIFDANHSFNDTKKNELHPPVVLKKMRFFPLTYHSGIHHKLKCIRLEVYGCKLVDAVGSNLVLTRSRDLVTYGSSTKTNKTWVISPNRKSDNSVILLNVINLEANCSFAGLIMSYVNHIAKATEIYCGKHKPGVVLLPASVQLWVRFNVRKTTQAYQHTKFNYSVESLGQGEVLMKDQGVIHGNRIKLARGNVTSIWLFQLKSGEGINLRFKNLFLPKENHSPFLIIKAGLLDSSLRIRRLDGVRKIRPLRYYSNELRIEYHPNQVGRLEPKHYKHGFTLYYSKCPSSHGKG